jgi:hypothetical protein
MPTLRFAFSGKPDREAVEADVTLALFAAEQVFGKPRVRLEAGYTLERDGRSCVLTATGEAGDAAARIFAGLTAVRLGEAAYTVRRDSPEPQPVREVRR